MNNRVELLRRELPEYEADALLITSRANRRFVSGFTGSAGVIWISAQSARLLTDFRYQEQVKKQSPGFDLVIYNGTDRELVERVLEFAAEEEIRRIAFEGDDVTVNQLAAWQEKAGDGLTFCPTKGWVERLRMKKTPEEVKLISRAAQIADHAFNQILPLIRSGIRESEIALELETIMRKAGAEGLSFAPIIAAGPNSALPHARPSDRMLRNGDFVVMDFGCLYGGYCSDMTRTLVVGEPSEQHMVIYDLVLQAQQAALQAVRPGVTGKAVDEVARAIIEEAGYGEYFGHGLGHGVGLEIHEGPRLSKTGDTVLEPGMVITIEPGVYIPDWGGVRIEDLAVVTEEGVETLSKSFKEMYVVD